MLSVLNLDSYQEFPTDWEANDDPAGVPVALELVDPNINVKAILLEDDTQTGNVARFLLALNRIPSFDENDDYKEFNRNPSINDLGDGLMGANDDEYYTALVSYLHGPDGEINPEDCAVFPWAP